MTKFGLFVGRVLMAALFIMAGYQKIVGFDAVVTGMTNQGLPIPQILAIVTIVIELGGGILLIVGWKARFAAFFLFIFVIIVSFLYHPFWLADVSTYQSQFNNFFKNMSIAGGLLYMITYGVGKVSK